MRIEALGGDNWMAYRGSFELELPSGPIGVFARYEGNPKRSNWAGKTALLEAIRFVLTGAHRKRTLDALITHGESSGNVWIRLTGGIVVKRVLERGKSMTISFLEIDGTVLTGSAAVDRLTDLVPNLADIEATFWFQQGDTEALVGQTSGARRALIWRWLELDVWDRTLARARSKASDVERRLDVLRAVPAPESVNVELVTGLTRMHRTKIENAEQRLAAIETSLDEVKTARSAVWQIEELEKLRETAKSLRSKIAGVRVIPATEIETRRTLVADADRDLGAAHAEAQSAQSARGQGFDGTCPVTRKACGISDEVRSETTAIEDRARAAGAALITARALRTVQATELLSMEREQQDRDRLVQRYNDTVSRVRELTPEAARIAAELEAIDVDVPALEEEKRRLRAEVGEARTMLGRCESDIARSERDAAAAERRAEEIAIEARESRIASLVTRAMGPSGIPAKIASVAISDLESRSNALLEGSGLSFTFGWGRDTKDPAMICYTCGAPFPKTVKVKICASCNTERGKKRSDDLEILVDDGSGEIEDAGMKSGGAKVLVATAIRLSSGAMLREQMIARGWGAPITFALVDEPFGTLDAENREELARKFSAMLGAVGLEQALIVSHDAQILDALPAKIVVTRRGDASSLHLEA